MYFSHPWLLSQHTASLNWNSSKIGFLNSTLITWEAYITIPQASPGRGTAANIAMFQVDFPTHIVMWPHRLVKCGHMKCCVCREYPSFLLSVKCDWNFTGVCIIVYNSLQFSFSKMFVWSYLLCLVWLTATVRTPFAIVAKWSALMIWRAVDSSWANVVVAGRSLQPYRPFIWLIWSGDWRKTLAVAPICQTERFSNIFSGNPHLDPRLYSPRDKVQFRGLTSVHGSADRRPLCHS
jgi:hypothetical protein